jgi:hypothetical protein
LWLSPGGHLPLLSGLHLVNTSGSNAQSLSGCGMFGLFGWPAD